jgi:hypothetical protein
VGLTPQSFTAKDAKDAKEKQKKEIDETADERNNAWKRCASRLVSLFKESERTKFRNTIAIEKARVCWV